jgi:hypothetical protein
MTRVVAAVAVPCVLVACTKHTVVRPGQYPDLDAGEVYEVTARTGHVYEVEVIGTQPGGALLVVDQGRTTTLAHGDIVSLRRTSHGMGWLHGFGWSMAVFAVTGLLSAASYHDDDDCDVACSPGDRFAVSLGIGLAFAITLGGAFGAIKGRTYVYDYQP